MKKGHWIIVLFLVSVCCFSTPAKAKTIELISPKNGATVNITNKKIKKWWNNYKKYSSAKNDEKKDYTEPDSITLKWKKEKGCKYKVCVSTNPYFKDMTVYSSKNCQEKLKRLLQDETYYWKVIGIKGDEKIVSETRCFETNDIARIVDVPNTTNVRDLGFNQFYNKMQSYENENESLSYNIECYLLDNGVTKTEISNIKEIMLSDNA